MMFDAAAALDVAANPHVVWRICKDHRRQFTLHKADVVRGFSRVAAQNPVLTQDPRSPPRATLSPAFAGDLEPSVRGRPVLGRGLLLADVGEEDVDFAELKAG
jgi:hypothetical protein